MISMTYAHTHATIVMICVEDPLGFEPRTTDLKKQGSATELRVQKYGAPGRI